MKSISKNVLLVFLCVMSSAVTASTITVENNWTTDQSGGAVSAVSRTKATRDSSVQYNNHPSGILKEINIETPEGAVSFNKFDIDKSSVGAINDKTYAYGIIDHNSFDYNTFGFWKDGRGHVVGAFADGKETSVDRIPVSGKAAFSGLTMGHHIDKNGSQKFISGTVSMQVDFLNRSIDFKTNNTRLENSPLNLSGTLAWEKNTNAFTGPVTTASGSLSGAADGGFYGPSANEAAGVFSLSPSNGVGVESYIGSFGVSKQ